MDIESARKGLELAEKGTTMILKYASKIREVLAGSFQIMDQEIYVQCIENTVNISTAFKASKGIVPRTLKFNFGKPDNIHLT